MAWCVSINIFRVNVSFVLHQSLDHSKVTSQTSDMQWCSKVVGPCVDLGPKLDQDLDHGSMTLTGSQMKWCEPIRVGAIDNLEHFILVIELLLCIAEDLVDLVGVSLIDLGPIIHLDLLDVLFPLLLLGCLLSQTGCHSLLLRALASSRLSGVLLSPTIASELIGLLIVVISNIIVLSILHIGGRLLTLHGL